VRPDVADCLEITWLGWLADIVLVTSGVILMTLLVQGPMLPAVVDWANLPTDHTAEQELRLAEQDITTSAIAALPGFATEHGVSDEV
jgi:CPA1 family monovalent cation:H+ antiporter